MEVTITAYCITAFCTLHNYAWYSPLSARTSRSQCDSLSHFLTQPFGLLYFVFSLLPLAPFLGGGVGWGWGRVGWITILVSITVSRARSRLLFTWQGLNNYYFHGKMWLNNYIFRGKVWLNNYYFHGRVWLNNYYFYCNGAEWSKDKTQAAESIKWRPQQAYVSNQFLLVQPQTVFSTHKIITLTHR